MSDINKQAILLFSCKDQKGLVFEITKQLFKIGGNITDLDEHVDLSESKFFVRIAFHYETNSTSENGILAETGPYKNNQKTTLLAYHLRQDL